MSTCIHYLIKNFIRRAVRDQHIRVCRDQIPMLSDVCPSITVECPIMKPRLNWRSPKMYAINFDSTVLKVMHVLRENRILYFLRKTLEKEIMISGNENFVLVMFEGKKPFEEFFYLSFCSSK